VDKMSFMKKKHPIIAVTGSSGAGTTTITDAFRDIFRHNELSAAIVTGDAFRRYDADEMKQVTAAAEKQGKTISHFGPEANLFNELADLFRDYSETGNGKMRHYVSEENDDAHHQAAGSFTPWEDTPDSDLLFYEGLHGGVVSAHWTRRNMSPSHNVRVKTERREALDNEVDVAQYVDLLVGVVPVVNLEWIQKIDKVKKVKGFSADSVTESILNNLNDYIHFVVPQFSYTDINFQRVPVVDTSNPFIARDVPSPEESKIVIRFREPHRYDLPHIMGQIENAFMSRPNTMVIPGGYLRHALGVICTPLIQDLIKEPLIYS